MKILFLRGKADRPKEIAFKSIESENDTWTNLMYAMTGDADTTKVLYWGGCRDVYYKDNFSVVWIDNLKYYLGSEPDVIVARGGFNEYVPILKEFPSATKVWYGANHGCIPKDGIKYDLIMCDSWAQVDKCKKHGLNGQLFIKPAPPQFVPQDVSKKYDVGFSAIWPNDTRKRVKWVHKTVPKGLKVLQMGHSCGAPKNVSVKLIDKDRMPRAISKCKVIIAPYTSEDSCPRIIPEALACGVPVVALRGCQFWHDKYPVEIASKEFFWDFVRLAALNGPKQDLRKVYEETLSIPIAAKHLRGLIENCIVQRAV